MDVTPTRTQFDKKGRLVTSVLNLTDERREELAPKLAVLLADFAKLEDLDRPDLEPAPPGPWREDDDDRG